TLYSPLSSFLFDDTAITVIYTLSLHDALPICVALVTPFHDDLSVDHQALANIVNHNIENGVEYLVISGTTGESVTVTKQEKQDIDRKSTRLNSSHVKISYAVFCLKKKKSKHNK